MKHISYWMDTTNERNLPEFSGEQTCDVAVIGAGITGLTTAVLLAQSGANVTVLEADRVGSGTTGNTTAKITVQHALKYQNLSLDKARSYLQANMAGLDNIEKLIQKHKIQCDFMHVPAFVYTRTPERIKAIMNEAQVYEKLGLKSDVVTQTSLDFQVTRALRLDGQAQFHPMKYLYALLDMLIQRNCRVFEHSKVIDIDKGNPCIAHTDKGKLTAGNLVLATGYPLIEFPGLFFMKLHQERSYIISTDAKSAQVKGMYINASRPVNSIRMHKEADKNVLLLGGYGHKTGQEEDKRSAYDSLERFLDIDFASAKMKPSYGWSSQDCVTLDEIPYIGAISKKHHNVYVATGYAKWGMTNATAAAMMITDSITGSNSIDEDVRSIFCPTRMTIGASAKNFFVQSANTVKEFTAGNVGIAVGAYNDVAPGTGAVLRIGGKAQAVYKDKRGKVSAFAAHCTHLGCPLEYNQNENTFDCACHGSRFAVDGSVLEGPAKEPLKQIREDGE